MCSKQSCLAALKWFYCVHTCICFHIQSITECLAEPEVSHSEHLPLLKQLTTCTAAVILSSDDACSENSLLLFTTLQRIQGSKHSQSLQDQASIENAIIIVILSCVLFLQIVGTLSALAKAQGMEDTACLYQIHIKDILSYIKVELFC